MNVSVVRTKCDIYHFGLVILRARVTKEPEKSSCTARQFSENGKPLLRYKHKLKQEDLNPIVVPLSSSKEIASVRAKWRSTCIKGNTTFERSRIRHQRRTLETAVTFTQPSQGLPFLYV